MIVNVTEYFYKGFHLQYVEDKGWKIVLCGEEILFPHANAAEVAINMFYREIVPQNKGKVLKKG